MHIKGKLTAALAALSIGLVSAGTAHAAPRFSAQPIGAERAYRPAMAAAMSDRDEWNQLFRRHTFVGKPFPRKLRGRFAGDPHIPVRDNRTTIGNVYQCTYYDDGSGRMIVCD